mgnify:CR=1 FL=1
MFTPQKNLQTDDYEGEDLSLLSKYYFRKGFTGMILLILTHIRYKWGNIMEVKNWLDGKITIPSIFGQKIYSRK